MAQISRRTIVITSFLAVVSLIARPQVSGCQTEKEPRGLPNFGRVAENLYRGGQPTSEGFKSLHAMGVGIIVDLREKPTEVASEKRQIESLGMKSIGIPRLGSREPGHENICSLPARRRSYRSHDRRLPHRCGT